MDNITSFLSEPGRENQKTVQKHKSIVDEQQYLRDLYNAVTDIVMILNTKRQVVFYNEILVKAFGLEDSISIYGLRPGEILNCINAFQTEGGCGTAEFCKTCGALNSIENSMKNDEQDKNECRIIQKSTGDAVDMLVTATPFTIKDKSFTIFAMKDISNEKRRKVLERIFFHDILNTAGGIRAISELIFDAEEEDLKLFRELLSSSSEKLVDEIFSQRDLTAAENNELTVNWESLDSLQLLKKMRDVYLMHEVAKNKLLELDSKSVSIKFDSDRALVSRVIGNLVKNALEASNENEKVTLGCYIAGDNIAFWVHNFSYIPKNIQLQLFNRSFSTKGHNRGLGTYSIKLLSEKYLNGHVLFASTPEEGTIFRVTFPIKHQKK